MTRSVYTGDASTVTVGQTLPGGGPAVANGTYPNVFNNATIDGSFGVTSPIFIDHISNSGPVRHQFCRADDRHHQFQLEVRAGDQPLDQRAGGDLHGLRRPANTLDVSNSNTPDHLDPTNPVRTSFQRAIVQVDADGNFTITPVNAYSGNNGRAAILANGQYYMVGNAGNGIRHPPTNIVNNTGVQITTPGGAPTRQ